VGCFLLEEKACVLGENIPGIGIAALIATVEREVAVLDARRNRGGEIVRG